MFLKVGSTIQFLLKAMGKFILDQGLKMIKNEENLKDQVTFTRKQLEFKSKMDQIIEKAFFNDVDFQNARDEKFQEFISQCPRSPQAQAFFCDF